MHKLTQNIRLAQILIIIGFLIGLVSLSITFSHIGDAAFLAQSDPTTHAWYHFFREGWGDMGAMTAVLLLIFSPAKWRNPVGWWVIIVLLVGYYAPFWIGIPFNPALSAPTPEADLIHGLMALFSVSGALFARKHFIHASDPVQFVRS